MPETEASLPQILLVDDDVGVAQMYSLHLGHVGYGVTTAHSGEDALELAFTQLPDLIYLDLGLPEMQGMEVLERLRSTPSTAEIPIVILTNFSEPDLVERTRVLGACDYLIKAHTTPSRLSETVRKWAAMPRRSV